MTRQLDTAPQETSDPRADATAVLRWAANTYGNGLCVTASFGDATLAHVAHVAVPGIPITLLDTGYLFAETEWFAEHLADRFGMSVRVVRPRPDLDRDVWATNTDACCAARKVEPLQRALQGSAAWVTGVRRADSESRQSAKFVHHDLLKSVVKINPLIAWTDADVGSYAADHGLPDHPLVDRGYGSIGCWPCTRPAADRTGRWADTDKTECGLHL